jgi:hypothetical protein
MLKSIVTTLSATAVALLAADAQAATWSEVGGCFTSISASDGTIPWAVGCYGGDSTGNPIQWYNPWAKRWTTVNGHGVAVAAAYAVLQSAPNLFVWAAEANGTVKRGAPNSSGTSVVWTTVAPAGSLSPVIQLTTDEFLAGTGVDAVGNQRGANGYQFMNFSVGASQPTYYDGAGFSFSQPQSGTTAWAVGGNSHLYNGDAYDGAWTDDGGCATWVSGIPHTGGPAAYAVGCDGDVWLFQSVQQRGVTGVWTSTGFTHKNMTQVSVGQNGAVWAIDSSGAVWVYE